MKALCEYTAKELTALEANANRVLMQGTEQKKIEARALLEKIAAEKTNRFSKKVPKAGRLNWDDSNKHHRVAYLNGSVVAEIKQDENHKSDNDEVYTVYVRGVAIEKRFRHIVDARAAIEMIFTD